MEAKWCYRGEGNASIVAACVKENVVYRIRKVENTEAKEGWQVISQAASTGIEFVQNVMKNFFSPQFLVPMKIAKVPDGLAEVIQTSWKLQRPEFRLCKSVICESTEAIEMPDLCFIYPSRGSSPTKPSYSFEIKPKWGFLPMADYVADEKKFNCRFCMHQFLKLSQGKWSKKSSYCPIDLFSGCRIRMKDALRNLYSSPQNNFCISQDGQRIWSDTLAAKEKIISDKLVEELLDIVVDCLLHKVRDLPSQRTSSHLPQSCRLSSCDHSCNEGCCHLPEGCVLSELLLVQHLDDLDIEGLNAHYAIVHDALGSNPENRQQSKMDGPYSHDWLEASSANSMHSSVEFSIHKVKQYLVSRSAKDCSIIVTVQEIDSESLLAEPPSRTFFLTSAFGTKFICCVSLIDLDPKSFDKIKTYVEEDKSVVDCFRKAL